MHQTHIIVSMLRRHRLALIFSSVLLLPSLCCYAADEPIAVIAESWIELPAEKASALTLWHGPEIQHRLIVTQIDGGIVMLDAGSGQRVATDHQPAAMNGVVPRPVAVDVVDDLAWVIDAQSQQVQVLGLPGLEPLGIFGNGLLREPADLWVQALGDDQYQVLVSDDFQALQGRPLTTQDLEQRVREFQVSVKGAELKSETGPGFGETRGAGALRQVGSISGDLAHDRILLLEKDPSSMPGVRVYDLSGSFTGQLAAIGLFDGTPMGSALYACPDGSGYWVLNDATSNGSLFHILERTTLTHVGSFRGARAESGIQIDVTRKSFPGFPSGALYAVTQDGSIAAYSWARVIETLSLQPTCPPPGAQLLDS